MNERAFQFLNFNMIEQSITNEINTLQAKLRKCKAQNQNDSEKLQLLVELVELMKDQNFTKACEYAHEAIELAEKLCDTKANAKAREGLANSLWKLSEYEESILQFQTALDLKLGLSDYYGVAQCYCGMGVISGILEQYDKALDYFERALSSAQVAKRFQLSAVITGNIGSVYFNLSRFEDSMQCFQHSHDYFVEIGYIRGIADMLDGMAGIYVHRGQYGEGIEILRKSLALRQQENYKRGIACSMLNIGIANKQAGKPKQAKFEFETALSYSRSINLKIYDQELLQQLMDVCLELGETESFRKYLQDYERAQYEERKQKGKERNIMFKPSQTPTL